MRETHSKKYICVCGLMAMKKAVGDDVNLEDENEREGHREER